MKIKRFLPLVLLMIGLMTAKPVTAFTLTDVLRTDDPILVRVQEQVKYWLTFNTEKKIVLLEDQAERRLQLAQNQAEEGNTERVQDQIQNYLQLKNRQDGFLEKVTDGDVLGAVAEKTIKQQQIMEEIKNRVDVDGKEGITQVQEQVVNQVAQRIVVVNGTEGQTEFFQKVEHVWAPGTGPGGEAGVVIEGGAMQFAPGTSAGGPSSADIKTVEVKTGGATNNEVVGGSGDSGGLAPGTTQGGSGGNTTSPGGVDSGDTPDSKHWIAP